MGGDVGTRDFWRVLWAYFVPPVGVFLEVGLAAPFWINLLLTALFWVPGQLHAVWVIVTTGPRGRPADHGRLTFLALLAAFFLPPLGVFLRRGLGLPVLVNALLSLLWIPGVVHAVWVITRADD